MNLFIEQFTGICGGISDLFKLRKIDMASEWILVGSQ
jgi:hypothetical protein